MSYKIAACLALQVFGANYSFAGERLWRGRLITHVECSNSFAAMSKAKIEHPDSILIVDLKDNERQQLSDAWLKRWSRKFANSLRPNDPSSRIEIGKKLQFNGQEYQTTQLLGTGGEGDVYEATNALGERHAIKTLHSRSSQKSAQRSMRDLKQADLDGVPTLLTSVSAVDAVTNTTRHRIIDGSSIEEIELNSEISAELRVKIMRQFNEWRDSVCRPVSVPCEKRNVILDLISNRFILVDVY